jgi:Domain of unknown function (DUF397)
MKDNTRQWRKSSYSGTGANCVEVRTDTSTVAVRDSKDVAGPELAFTGQAWSAFVAAVKRGELSL